jgi:hypothetical protein
MSEPLDLLARMARREAAALLLCPDRMTTSPGITAPATFPVLVRPIPCGECYARASSRPDLEEWTVANGESSPDGRSVVEMLACEWLAPRAWLPVVTASVRFGPRRFQTRAAAWSRRSGPDKLAFLRALEASEAWVTTLDTAPPDRVLTVPASTRAAGVQRSLLSPHSRDDADEEFYLGVLRATVTFA